QQTVPTALLLLPPAIRREQTQFAIQHTESNPSPASSSNRETYAANFCFFSNVPIPINIAAGTRSVLLSAFGMSQNPKEKVFVRIGEGIHFLNLEFLSVTPHIPNPNPCP
ncbi:hypothetical protein AABB24_008349, partial [Solanum stoloniferum]